MARALTVTKLPLATWAKYMGMHPLHFEQVRLEPNPHCDQIMFQYAWQTSEHVSREEIAEAIAEAEARIEKYLQYRLKPTWEVDEWRDTIRPYQREMVNYNNHDIRGYNQNVPADWGYFITGGVEVKALLLADAAIVYTDEDSDGYFETATVTVPAGSLTDFTEIGAFYPGTSGDDAWEIRPTEVVLSGSDFVITFRRELAVNPDLFDRLDIEGAEAIGTVDADFLDKVDVYRRYNDPSHQVDLLWEPIAGLCGFCGGTGCESCAYATATGCLMVRGDPRNSIVVYHPATWDADTLDFISASLPVHRQPDIVRLYYQAGWRNKKMRYPNRMDPEWERAVTYLAAANLSRPPCDCVMGHWLLWSDDTQLEGGGQIGNAKSLYRQPDPYQENPFGFKRGEIYAWRKIQAWRRARGVLLV
jgi:hypothetical protein